MREHPHFMDVSALSLAVGLFRQNLRVVLHRLAEDEWGRALLRVAWWLRELRGGEERAALKWLFSKPHEEQESILATAELEDGHRRWQAGSLTRFALAKYEESKQAMFGTDPAAESTTIASAHGQASTVAEAASGQSMMAPLSQKVSASATVTASATANAASASAMGQASKSQSTANVGGGTPLMAEQVAVSSP